MEDRVVPTTGRPGDPTGRPPEAASYGTRLAPAAGPGQGPEPRTIGAGSPDDLLRGTIDDRDEGSPGDR